MVDIWVPSLHMEREYVYPDGSKQTRVMLDVFKERLEQVADPDEYTLHVSDDPDLCWIEALDQTIRNTDHDLIICDDDHYILTDGFIQVYQKLSGMIPNAAVMQGRVYFPLTDRSPADSECQELDSFKPGCIQQNGSWFLPNFWSEMYWFCRPEPPKAFEVCRQVTYCPSGVAYYRRDFLNDLYNNGGLDLQFGKGSHFEDVHLSLEAWRLGWECWAIPSVQVVHYGGITKRATGQLVDDRTNLNHAYMIQKYGSEWLDHLRRMTAYSGPLP